MNCANHPELTATAFCQFCGKPLCASCVRTIRNIVGCEPCLAARLGAAPAAAYSTHVGDGQNFQYTTSGSIPPPLPHGTPNPILAALLGLIPGVGAMYNGQFAKAIVHVLVFIMLIDMTQWNPLIGIGIAAWVFYQIFDAYHTAIARRDGLPLPNPMGLNDIGKWFSGHPSNWGAGPPAGPRTGSPFVPPAAAPFSGDAGTPFGTAPIPPVHPHYPVDPYDWGVPTAHSSIPARAVVLILLGVMFLLGNFGILRGEWVGHLWPLVLIGLGVWLLIQRSRPQPPSPGAPGNTAGGPQ